MFPQIVIDVLGYGHVLSAMGWLGGGILLTFVVGPNLRKMSPSAGLEFNAKVLPTAVRFLQVMIGSTFVFGILLYYVVAEDLTGIQSEEIQTGIVVALVTAAVVFSLTLPSFMKVIRISDETLKSGKMPPPPELMKAGKKGRQGSIIGVVLLLVVLAMMIASGFS